MFSPLASCLLALSLAAFNPVSAIWPAPQTLEKGESVLYLHQNLEITYNGRSLPYTYGFVPNDNFDSKELVQAAVSRTLDSIFSDDFVPWMVRNRHRLSDSEPKLHEGQTWVKSLQIVQTETDKPSTFKPLAGDVDESYNLTLSENGHAKLTAVSSTGVLHGLETFNQLFYKHSGGPFWYTPFVPLEIRDFPKFPHRGILMDVARNWFPVKDILRTLDAMSWSKLNRLHIHITDSQSWPLDIPALPELSKKGAYRPDLTYSPDDIEHIQKYAIQRGIEVILEIDMPGHIGSVSWSQPELIVAYDAYPYYWYCAEPPCGAFKLNDTGVDKFLETMFDDLLPRLSPYSAYFHTGGDELNANDSMLDPGVNSNSTEVLQPLLQKFIDVQHGRVRKAGLVPMVWEEIPLEWNVKIGKDTVIQTWLGADSVKNLTSQGYKIIDSNYNYWYLDCGRGQWNNFENGLAYDTFFPFNDWCDPNKNWRLIYSHDPVAGLTEEQAKLVLGGEVAAWSESIDTVTIDSILWPRASVAGEVLWSGRQDASGQNRSQMEAAPRLDEMRARMVARGMAAAAISMPFCSQANNATKCSYPM